MVFSPLAPKLKVRRFPTLLHPKSAMPSPQNKILLNKGIILSSGVQETLLSTQTTSRKVGIDEGRREKIEKVGEVLSPS